LYLPSQVHSVSLLIKILAFHQINVFLRDHHLSSHHQQHCLWNKVLQPTNKIKTQEFNLAMREFEENKKEIFYFGLQVSLVN
jgi:oligoribonuclease NrnB/cAMP/cGMP phosphodiesterase (DHH superfamily)